MAWLVSRSSPELLSKTLAYQQKQSYEIVTATLVTETTMFLSQRRRLQIEGRAIAGEIRSPRPQALDRTCRAILRTGRESSVRMTTLDCFANVMNCTKGLQQARPLRHGPDFAAWSSLVCSSCRLHEASFLVDERVHGFMCDRSSVTITSSCGLGCKGNENSRPAGRLRPTRA